MVQPSYIGVGGGGGGGAGGYTCRKYVLNMQPKNVDLRSLM